MITLKDVRLPEENHLQAGKSFRDTARVLRQTRYMVGWEATGCQMGAFEHTLKYAQERLQFGRPIGSFQLIQDLLSKMLANVTACQCLVVRTGQLDDQGKLTDAQAERSPRRLPPPSVARLWRGAGRYSAATVFLSITTSADSSRTPKRLSVTKARLRCRVSFSAKPSQG